MKRISESAETNKNVICAKLFFSSFHFNFTADESPTSSLVFGERLVQVAIDTQKGQNLVTTVKETISSPSYSRLIAEVEKQYVAITPPDSPEPQGLVCEMRVFICNDYVIVEFYFYFCVIYRYLNCCSKYCQKTYVEIIA